MLAFRTTGRFEKEFKLAVKRGKEVSKLQAVMRALFQYGQHRAGQRH